MRGLLGLAVALMVLVPGVALAQSPGPPVVELGLQVDQPSAPKAAQSTPPPDKWRRLKPGRKVWVTTNTGSLVHGEVTAITNSNLNIREQDREVTIRLDDVSLVEGRDGLKDGFLFGAVPGAIAGGLLFAGIESHCDSCVGVSEPNETGAFLGGAVIGGAVGGLFGLMVDALIPGRQTLVGGSTTVVTPVITPTKNAIDVAIRWR